MKKNILLIIMCGLFFVSLTGCGTQTPNDAERLELKTLFQDMSDNVAAAEKKYDKNYYKIDVSVMNLETKYFTYRYNTGNKVYSIDIFMSQDELASLKNGSDITIIGKFDIINDNYIKIKNASVVSE